MEGGKKVSLRHFLADQKIAGSWKKCILGHPIVRATSYCLLPDPFWLRTSKNVFKAGSVNSQIHCHRLPLWRKYSPEVKAAKGLSDAGQKSRELTNLPEPPNRSALLEVGSFVTVFERGCYRYTQYVHTHTHTHTLSLSLSLFLSHYNDYTHTHTHTHEIYLTTITESGSHSLFSDFHLWLDSLSLASLCLLDWPSWLCGSSGRCAMVLKITQTQRTRRYLEVRKAQRTRRYLEVRKALVL